MSNFVLILKINIALASTGSSNFPADAKIRSNCTRANFGGKAIMS